jgi:CheY-like chemotaxis protein
MSHPASYLVACSDPCERNALLNVLSAPGVTVQQAATIMEAERILSAATAVVFCEDRLPGGGYPELLRAIQQGQFQIPLVVASTRGGPEQYLEAMELGADDYITPPYDKQVIDSIVERRCERRRPMVLPVQIYGVDCDGVPFFENVCTQDISRGGARITGIHSKLSVGDRIGVNYCDRANVCRVAWVGALEGVGGAQEIGVEHMDPEHCSWNFSTRPKRTNKS